MSSATTPVKRRYATRMAPAERREQLLDAALDVIVERGVHKVSIDSVAKQAGVTRPVVYGHFEDSGALLRASLNREEQRVMEQFFDAVDGRESLPARERIRGLVTAFLTKVDSAPQLWRAVFMLSDSSTPQFRARLDTGRAAAVQTLEEFLRRVLADSARTARNASDSTDSAVDVELWARMTMAILWEAGRLRLTDPDSYSQDRLVTMCDGLIAMSPAG